MRTVIFAISGYFFLLLTVRVMARRPGAQLTPFEFVVIFLIGGVSIRETLGSGYSMTNSVCAVIAVCLMHRLISMVRARSQRFAAWLDGLPLLLLRDGTWQEEAMRGMRLEREDVMAAARERGLSRLEDIRYAVVERTGMISIIKR